MKTKITLFCLLAFLFFIPKISAQCTTGTQYPIDTYQATNSAGAGIINTDARLGQYARVHIVPDKRYKFSTSVATDFITVTNDNGVVLASGVAEVYYISVFDEAIRLVDSGRIDLRPFITGVLPINDITKAMHLAADKVNALKIQIQF